MIAKGHDIPNLGLAIFAQFDIHNKRVVKRNF